MLHSQNKIADKKRKSALLMENPKDSNKLEKLAGAIYLVVRKETLWRGG